MGAETDWSAAILIGGLSERFVGPKFLSKVGGKTLIRRVAEAVVPPGGDLMLVTGRGIPPDVAHEVSREVFGLRAGEILGAQVARPRFIEDTPGLKTLAAGVEAALLAAESTVVFVAAADLPFIERGLVLELVQRARDAHAAVPFHRGLYEPVCAAYNGKILPIVSRYRSNPSGPMSSCFEDPSVSVARLMEEEIRKFGDPAVLFLNVNTREDLRRAETHATSKGRRSEREIGET